MNIFNYFGQYIRLATISDVVDILIVAALLYKLIKLIRNTAAARLLKGIFVILAIMYASELFSLHVVNFIMLNAMQLGTFALVVIFQPELRRILEQFGKTDFRFLRGKKEDGEATQLMVMQIVDAVSKQTPGYPGVCLLFSVIPVRMRRYRAGNTCPFRR